MTETITRREVETWGYHAPPEIITPFIRAATTPEARMNRWAYLIQVATCRWYASAEENGLTPLDKPLVEMPHREWPHTFEANLLALIVTGRVVRKDATA